MDGVVSIAAILAMLLVAGFALSLLDRRRFSARWLLVATALVALNDVLLTRAYGLVPDPFSQTDWNWTGKLLALAATLVVATLPAFGWRRTGLTLAQGPGSLPAAVPPALAYCGFFVAVALAFPGEPATVETVAFQLTMPGLEEELFYRGVLLFALDRAFSGRIRILGVEWGWGALLSCWLFGMTHAFGYSDGAFTFDPVLMALTAIPSFIAVWLRLRTGSLTLPLLLHNFGNALPLLL